MTEQEVTAWDVKGAVVDGVQQAIDYNKIVVQFGSSLITPELLERFERVTGRKPHRFMRRNIFYSHRDLDKILDLHEQGKPFYLYTGRGPSSDALHCGHMVPFILCQYLQDVFNVPIVIQLTDDEKFLVKDMSLEDGAKYLRQNAKDVIACGFKLEKTFMFSNSAYYQFLLPNILKVQKSLNINESNKAFGFSDSDCIGKFGFPAVQIVPCFSDTFLHIFGPKKNIPCLIPCAIDQDVYFRLTRDMAPSLKYQKPALIHSKFFPALQGAETKMSASDLTSSIFVCDTPEQIEEKILKYAKGATYFENGDLDIDSDILYSYLSFFLEDDDELARIKLDYCTKKLSEDEVRKILVKVLQDMIAAFQERRAKVTDEILSEFYSVRDMKS